MDVVWDPKKASFNFAKHGVMFADAATVLDDPCALTIEDRRYNEERFVTVGSDAFGRVLVVVYTYPPNLDAVRLISARRSTASEKKHYHGQS